MGPSRCSFDVCWQAKMSWDFLGWVLACVVTAWRIGIPAFSVEHGGQVTKWGLVFCLATWQPLLLVHGDVVVVRMNKQ
jgi:hypothetical protein